ncbi:CheW-like protein [Hyella patelloides LEGE 07179]|uniref:CheW-like protein n=1 Tax=Hyella patelloides LEGE 07179 TaxID=945734 RepID=A0A563VTL0_9CYAN|nr:chemotaxis protein CheW [Hyella patelloides]VEP14780.1 CheW-like protein [Hyella patelloides LEGE 07179]
MMINQTLTTLDSAIKNKQPTTSTIKLLVFSIGKLTLALPVEQVKRVTKYTPIHGSGMSYINLTHIGKQEVTVVDLHQKLFKISHDELTPDGGYFILTKSRPATIIKNGEKTTHDFVKESIGIRVMEAPTLLDIALSDIRTLPSSYRYADTLEIASHVAVIAQDNQTSQTIFILDLEHLI